MPRRASPLERSLASLVGVDGTTPEGATALRSALESPHAPVVARAATAIREQGLDGLGAAMVAAFDRFFDEPDPSCAAKTALAEALDHVEHRDERPFLRGVSHVQPEPAWGGPVDVATALRVRCGFALARLGGPDVLDVLADLLGDPEISVRAGAARAIGYLGRGTPLLRLKLHGKDEPEVLADCLASLCRLDADAGLRFGRRLLGRSADVREAAALALGESRLPGALPVLVEMLDAAARPADRRTVLIAIGLLRIPAGIDLLIRRLGDGRDAQAAAEALGPACFDPRVRERVVAAIGDRPALLALLPG